MLFGFGFRKITKKSIDMDKINLLTFLPEIQGLGPYFTVQRCTKCGVMNRNVQQLWKAVFTEMIGIVCLVGWKSQLEWNSRNLGVND